LEENLEAQECFKAVEGRLIGIPTKCLRPVNQSYLSEADARNALIYHQKQLVEFIYAQMQAHHWEKATGYDVVVSKGFTELKPSAYTAAATDPIHDFRQTVQERTRIARMLFGGFQRCLYRTQKFQSDSERKLAVILDREALK
jgi:type III restriction enzyme